MEMRSEKRLSARAWLIGLALGSAAFTLTGSLVPFEFRLRALGDAIESYGWAMENRVAIQSRSDAIANVLLGVPLGFALLGAWCVDRYYPRRGVIARALVVILATMVFAAGIEFVQLFAPSRTCCATDVLAQGLGAVAGAAIWLAAGPWLAGEVRAAASGSGTAGRFLLAYIAFLGFVEALPLDLTLSPYAAYHKYRSGEINLIPFAEFRAPNLKTRWAVAASLLKLAALAIPVGLLAGCLPGRFWMPENALQVALAAFTLTAGIELGQILVKSRTASSTDILVGGTSMILAWLLVRIRTGRALTSVEVLGLGAWWLILVAVISWQPFNFVEPVQPFDWVLGMPLQGPAPLIALDAMLAKIVIFGLCGVIVACSSPGRTDRSRRLLAATFALIISAMLEIGQLWLSHHTPGITDVLLGGLGAFCGAWAASLVRMRGV